MLRSSILDQAGFFERDVRTVLGERLQSAGGEFDRYGTIQFRNENTLLLQVRLERTDGGSRNVHTDTALFLGFTGTENLPTDDGNCSCDFTKSGHKSTRIGRLFNEEHVPGAFDFPGELAV